VVGDDLIRTLKEHLGVYSLGFGLSALLIIFASWFFISWSYFMLFLGFASVIGFVTLMFKNIETIGGAFAFALIVIDSLLFFGQGSIGGGRWFFPLLTFSIIIILVVTIEVVIAKLQPGILSAKGNMTQNIFGVASLILGLLSISSLIAITLLWGVSILKQIFFGLRGGTIPYLWLVSTSSFSGILGLYCAVKQRRISQNGFANTGLVLSITTLAILGAILLFVMWFVGQRFARQ
jgi:hypothetical protein